MAGVLLKQAAALGASYTLGTFNDNFFKQAALLLAVSLGYSGFQAWGTFLFALPFVLFSAWAGWLADRFPKKYLVTAAKCLELAAMLVGAWGILSLNWTAMLLMLFCMGASSTLFSPALNGSIPEIFPPHSVPRVNALFKLFTTASILLGVMLAGAALDRQWVDTLIPFGRWLVAVGVVLVAVLGLAGAALVPYRPAVPCRERPPFPWLGTWDSLNDFLRLRRDRALALVIAADAFFYFISTLVLLEINSLGVRELGFSKTVTSLLPTALMLGICAGSLLAARGTPRSWRRWLVPSCCGIGCALLAAGFAPQLPQGTRFWSLLLMYGAAGMCGGLYLIPVSSFIQVRPAPEEKGRVLGTDNCLVFSGILLASAVYWGLEFFAPSTGHMILGGMALAAAVCLAWGLRSLPAPDGSEPSGEPETAERGGMPPASGSEKRNTGGRALDILAALLRGLLSLRYRVRVDGLEAVSAANDDRPILFMPNHPALMDPVLVYSHLIAFRPRPLADEWQISRPLVRRIAPLARPVPLPDLRAQGRTARGAVLEALTRCAEALKAGDNLLFYPAGGLSRDGQEHLGANSGAHWLLQQVPHCRVVLVRSRGLWGSSFSHAAGKHPDMLRGLARGARRLLCNLLFFMPRREVRISLHELRDLPPAEAGAPALNRTLEAWYDAEPEEARAVPYYFWQGDAPRPLPRVETEDGSVRNPADALHSVDRVVREQVYAILADSAAVEVDPASLTPETRLAADLGIDSLALTELSLKLEDVAGHSVSRLDLLLTAGDCALAAAGLLEDGEDAAPAPEGWAADASHTPARRLDVPDAPHLPLAILRQARRSPTSLILADAGGAVSWREFWTRALALALLLSRRCAGQERVGVMLPAAGAAAMSWLAVLLAGKTPVMFNWTTGPANFSHCARLAEVRTILTARQLLERLDGQGFDAHAAARAGATWLCLEDAAAAMPWGLKLAALVRGRLALLGWERAAMPGRMAETAAVLFTSGSETAPKGVPLSHANILANCRDIAAVLSVTGQDRMLGMLPPFHSLGLTGNIALPLCFGLPVVFHPNPTEAARLNRICRRWRPTLTVAPPTFLDGMLQQAAPGDLASLRLGFVGAEACPQRIYDAFAAQSGGVLCEGYGVTECAPAVSVNRPEDLVPGSIGLPLPSVEVALVSTQGPLRRVAGGEAGMLLVRGPNVFAGYLAGPGQTPPDPFVAFEGLRWYRTGDLVRADAQGRLTFAGRLGRFVKLGGEMISLPQMENALLDYQARRDAAMPHLAGESGPALAVESVERDGLPEIVLCSAVPFTREEANAALREAGLSALYVVRRVLRLEAVPVLGTGKTDYRALKALAADGE